MKVLRVEQSYKRHGLIGLLVGVWLAVFLVVIAPFDAAELPFKIRLILLPFYGVITFVVYIALIPLQNWVYQQLKNWNIVLEILFIGLFQFLVLLGGFTYYKTSFINGNYSFQKFTFEVYYPIFLVLLFVIIFSRWYLFKPPVQQEVPKLTLKGENKLDVLHINPADLVCVSSADNYVEVSYMKDGILQKKLLRNTLKNMQQEVDGLLKVHRAHLINPSHLVEWKDPNTLSLTQMDVPITKTYKKTVLALKNHP